MRISQYKGILEILDSVIEATEYMRNRNTDELCEICAQSLQSVHNTLVSDQQNCDAIEKSIGIAIECFKNKDYNTDKLSILVVEIKESAKTDIRYKLRVLFVAELGGKWDSMASVYEAFCKRDDCDVDVVLEPIFREVQYSDGSTKREVIYNDWLTPLGIKHILYNHYDMASIRPDITFFSQPYESCTIPMFWPENMSQYTKLVYLPYYTPLRIDEFNIGTFNIFFKSLTEKYSWRIACQSDVFKEYYYKYGSNKGENVISCGIPKWDYPFSFSKTRYPCPDEWLKKIKDKKVFLWNTHFSIEESNFFNYCDKLIEIFEKNDNLALVWRPHPMFETIIKMYYPEKYDRLLAFVSRIEKSSNMVIDTFPSYGYSFVWTDAMISDISSLAIQYMIIDKPVFFVISDAVSDDEYIKKLMQYNEVFDYTKVIFSSSIEKINKFIYDIYNDIDFWSVNNNYLKSKYYNYADGKIGDKLSHRLISEYIDEVLC